MFDEEISTSRSLFEYNISILVVWVNHLINLKVQFIISKSQRTKEIKNKENKTKRRKAWRSCRGEAAMYSPRMGLAYCVLLHSSLWVVVCGRSVCDLVNACVWCSCVFITSSGWGVSSSGGTACRFHLRAFLTLSLDGAANVHYNRLSICPLYH